MPDTPLGITYPTSTDHTRMWEHFQTLANDVDALLSRKGYINEGTRNTPSAAVTTTETVVQSLTFTAVAGVRYKVTAVQALQSSVVNDLIQARIRWAVGGSVTSAGTEIATIMPNADVANRGQVYTLVGTLVAPSSGSITVGFSIVRNAGTGNVLSHGAAQMVDYLLVEGV